MTLNAVTITGHFGELMQGRVGAGGPVALITLPCNALTVEARIAPVSDPHGLLPSARGRALLERLGLPDPGPVTLVASMPRGGGAGASTAALVAYARLAGSQHSSQELARACVSVEGASDPLMFPEPARLLWASRKAVVLETFPALPAFDILGGFFGPNRRTDPKDDHFADIADLIEAWRDATNRRDVRAMARLASISADRNLLLRGLHPDPTSDLAKQCGALGHVIAHTGSARGLLFEQGTIPAWAPALLAAKGFRRIVSFRLGAENN